MQNSKKTIIITILIYAGFTPLCLAVISANETKPKHPTAFELLDRFAENQDKLNSFIAKTESVSKRFSQDNSEKQAKMRRTMTEFRYEKSDSNLKVYYWFRYDENRGDDGIWIPADRCHSVVWDGKLCYEHHKASFLDSSDVYVMSDQDNIKRVIAIIYEGAGPILGILYGDLERFDSILRQSDSITIRSELEQVDSIDCYVIDAKTKHGTYTVWLDPEHGYNIAKATVHKGPEDLRFGRQRSSYVRSSDAESFFLENVRFKNIEGVWIPMEADYRLESQEENRTRTGNDHYKITQIDINPNHAELQSFVPDVQNGTEVRIFGAPGIEYKWQEGMKFITDEWDGSIKYVPNDWSMLVGVGKLLPQFQNIKIKLSVEQIKKKAILLCFFDMEQRPSRNCLRQLSKRTQELKAKDIVVIAVQTSKMDENKLNKWVKGNNIPFPVGMIEGNEAKIRFTWGVRSLPWLILTNKQHIVRAEGFALHELDEKISAATQK